MSEGLFLFTPLDASADLRGRDRRRPDLTPWCPADAVGTCCPHDIAKPTAAAIPSSRGTCQALPRRLLLGTRTAALMSHDSRPAVPHLRPQQHLIGNRQPSLAGLPQQTHLLR
jgi:hypothetical protein